MEAYFTNRGFPPSHSCDVAVNWTYDRWLQQGESHPFLGFGNIIYGVALYIPCCRVLLQPDMRSVTAYKMLFVVSVCQIISLVINSIIAGVFFIMGVVYCNFPLINYLVGCVVMLVWASTCITCLILSASRLVDLWSSGLHDTLFGGLRVIFAFIIIFFYSMSFWLYAKPAVFNSKELAWIFDPLVYPDGNHFDMYGCYITILNNEGTVGLTLLLTLMFILSLAYKSFRYGFKMSSTQKQLFVQSSFSSLSSLVTASIYVSFQFVSAGRWYTYLGLLTWQISTAGELILFLFINKTIQRRVLRMLGLRKKGAVGTTLSLHSRIPSAKPEEHESKMEK